jgi:hypothetical protein
MVYDEEKVKSHKDLWGLWSFYFICILGPLYYQGVYWVSWWSANHQSLYPNKSSYEYWTYLGFWPDSRNLNWTCLTPSPDMSGPALAPQWLSLSWTYPAPVLGSRKWNRTYPAPSPDMFNLSVVTRVRPRHWTCPDSGECCWTCPAPSFLGDIWASFSVTHSTFKQNTSLTISMCSFFLGTCPLDGLGCMGVTKVVVDLRKFVLPTLSWGFDSGNRTRLSYPGLRKWDWSLYTCTQNVQFTCLVTIWYGCNFR